MRLLTEEELDGMVDNSNELKRILSDYLSYWKWFILSVVLCVVGGRIYLHYATPVYRVSTTIMINVKGRMEIMRPDDGIDRYRLSVFYEEYWQ